MDSTDRDRQMFHLLKYFKIKSIFVELFKLFLTRNFTFSMEHENVIYYTEYAINMEDNMLTSTMLFLMLVSVHLAAVNKQRDKQTEHGGDCSVSHHNYPYTRLQCSDKSIGSYTYTPLVL